MGLNKSKKSAVGIGILEKIATSSLFEQSVVKISEVPVVC